jgi:hypothetical protein
MDTTIVICYAAGTESTLDACLRGIEKHTGKPVKILVVTRTDGVDESNHVLLGKKLNSGIIFVPESSVKKGWEHGSMLDYAMSYVNTEFVLTMDSDSITIADGWLDGLHEEIEKQGVVAAGILHPWAPPPENMSKKMIEYRVRSQHCWLSTHVACQLVRTKSVTDLIRAGKGFTTGDDTGLGMIVEMRKNGVCTGYKPTRCPKPSSSVDAEFNRYTCVVYGDKVIHLGGATRIAVNNDVAVFDNSFAWAKERVIKEGGEFLLDDEQTYRYTFDKEDEVAKEKMQRLFGLVSQRMKE